MMTEPPESFPETANLELAEKPVETPEAPKFSDRTNFLVAAAAGLFLAVVVLLLSMEMSQKGIADVSMIEWAVVAVMPFMFGVLGVKFKNRLFDAIEAILPVPF